MSWNLLRRECHARFARYAWKTKICTFDTAVVASARLAGGTRFLSFDTQAKALGVAKGFEVFTPLDAEGQRILSELKHEQAFGKHRPQYHLPMAPFSF